MRCHSTSVSLRVTLEAPCWQALGLVLSLLVAVAVPAAADRGRTPAQASGNLPNRVASGHQGLDPASSP